jgi:hypothetical protein
MLFAAVNPYKQKVYLLGEIYAQNQANTSTSKIIPEMRKIRRHLYPLKEEWSNHCDEAGAWFINEAAESYSEHFFKTQKHLTKKTNGLSLIKDQLLEDFVIISDRCTNLVWEMENYIKDKNGNIPKKNDHLIDCYRYLNRLGSFVIFPMDIRIC